MRSAACTAILMALLTLTTGHAGIISSTPDVTLIAPPLDIRDDVLQSDTSVYVFQERTVTLGADLLPDLDVDNHSYAFGEMALLDSIPAGTIVTSYYVHFDSVSGQIGSATQDHIVISTGMESITFCQQVVGVLYRDFKLNNTDAGMAGQPHLGVPTTQYGFGESARGSEPNSTSVPDFIEIAGNTVNFVLNTSNPFDDFRILTLSHDDCLPVLPEATSCAVWAMMGLVGLMVSRQNRRSS